MFQGGKKITVIFRCLLGWGNRVNNVTLELVTCFSIYISLLWIGGYQWRTTTKAFVVINCTPLLIQLELHKGEHLLTSHHMERQVSPHQLDYTKQSLGQNCDTYWAAEVQHQRVESTRQQFFDQTVPPLTQPTVSALRGTPSSGLGCVTRKRSHGKWELELLPSGTICTVGKQGLIFSRKTKHSKLIQQTEILQTSWTNAIFSLPKKSSFLAHQCQQWEAKDINVSVLCKLNFSLKTFWQTSPDELKFYMSYNCLEEKAILAC